MSKTKKEHLTMTMNLAPLRKLAQKSPEIFRKAMEKGAIQFLTWANDGSPQETRKPPIRWGVLRGSASAFVGSKLVTFTTANDGEPQLSHNEQSQTTMTWIWNTNYAAKMHEHTGNWGEFTLADTDAGNKWLEKHLQADKDALMQMVEKEYWLEAQKLSAI